MGRVRRYPDIDDVIRLRFGSQDTTLILFLYSKRCCVSSSLTVIATTSTNAKWLSMGLARLIPNILAAAILMGILIYFLRIPFSMILGTFVPSNAFDPEKMVTGILYYTFFVFLWSVLHFMYNYFEKYNKSLQLEASVKEIELSNLKSQLNPHFIFNALNSIRALVDENPAKAKQAINQLSSILRNSLVTEKRGLTSFDEELKLVRDYLGLESIRFEERLKTEFDLDPESKDFHGPSTDDPNTGRKRHQARNFQINRGRSRSNKNKSGRRSFENTYP